MVRLESLAELILVCGEAAGYSEKLPSALLRRLLVGVQLLVTEFAGLLHLVTSVENLAVSSAASRALILP